jgi:cytochrome c oxidase subunit 2
MLFNVKVVSPQDYQAHIEALRAAGQTGQLITGRIDTNATGDKQGRTTIGGNQ